MNVRSAARQMLFAYLGLLVLLAVGVLASNLSPGFWQSAICVFTAVLEALLVIIFLMEVRSSPQLIWVLSGGAFVWLAILASLVYADYFTRNGRF